MADDEKANCRKRYIPPHKRQPIASNSNSRASHNETQHTPSSYRGRGGRNHYTAHHRSYNNNNYPQQRQPRHNYNDYNRSCNYNYTPRNNQNHSNYPQNYATHSPPKRSYYVSPPRYRAASETPPLSASQSDHGSSSLHTCNNNESTFIENDEKEEENDEKEENENDDDCKTNTQPPLPSPPQIPHESKQDKAFAFYLDAYKAKHQKKYIAPFQIRRIRREYDSAIKEQRKQKKKEEGEANKDANRREKVKELQHEDNINNESENEMHSSATDHATANKKANDCELESHNFPMEYLFFRDFYLKYSTYFSEWTDMRQDGWNNKHLEKFFNLKHKNQDNVSRSSDKNIVALFRRFYRYAIDIDNVCGYKQHLISLLNQNHNERVYFLDIGFAPGGMSRLLLDGEEEVYGVGITLPPYECGNAFINELLHCERFLCREHDVVQLGQKIHNRSDFLSKCIENDYSHNSNTDTSNWKAGFAGFDLIIVGITCHQDFNSNERLDHQILLSELYLAFLTLNNGGSILIRHKIALDCIHQHILYIFLKCFTGGYQVGKPMTEFAIRKTFWILWKGFDKSICAELKLISFLRKLIHEYDGQQPPYGKNPKTQQYHNPHMIDKTPQQIVDELQPQTIINVMDPVFEIQMKSLKSFCNGKKDRLCSKGKYCNRKDCNRAHSKEECIKGFYEALQNVDYVLNEQVAINKHHSKILTSLDKLNKNKKRKHKHKNNHNHHHNNNNNDIQSNNWRRSATGISEW